MAVSGGSEHLTLAELDEMMNALRRIRERVAASQASPELVAARRIAAECSRQTGKTRQNFIDGRYDKAYGVRTALRAIRWARENYEARLPSE